MIQPPPPLYVDQGSVWLWLPRVARSTCGVRWGTARWTWPALSGPFGQPGRARRWCWTRTLRGAGSGSPAGGRRRPPACWATSPSTEPVSRTRATTPAVCQGGWLCWVTPPRPLSTFSTQLSLSRSRGQQTPPAPSPSSSSSSSVIFCCWWYDK